MCGITGASNRVTDPGHCPTPAALDAELDPAGEQDLHPDADTEHRPARRYPRINDLFTADAVQTAHTGFERADAGDHQPISLQRLRLVCCHLDVGAHPLQGTLRGTEVA